jgi:glycosyltransferase involved in cell wall biosynthesis
MKIGFISILGERGQWHVTKNFMRALQDEHELFLLGRPFGVRDGVFIGNIHDYDIKTSVKLSPVYTLSPDAVKEWIVSNNLEVVVFNEELNWTLVDAAKEAGAKTVTYLDYFTAETLPLFAKYDLVIVCAQHAYKTFIEFGLKNTKYIDWGVDTELFKPTVGEKTTFFHSAGWGGVNWRKCSPDILRSFDELRKMGRDYTLFFHSQTGKCQYPEDCQRIIDKYVADGSMQVFFGSVPHPGLYYKGKINVAPSILEGLGLFLPEGLACGMPTITTDAPPMNQWVKMSKNGLLIGTKGSHYRKDPYFFPEWEIDTKMLTEAMDILGSDPESVSRMAAEARKGITEVNSFELFKKNVISLFETLR